MEELSNGLSIMLLSTELNQLQTIHIKLEMEHVIMILHKPNSQLKHILISIKETVIN